MQLATRLRDASRIYLFTGAGISTSSGIPDFRGPQGVWKRRKPVYYDDFMSNENARFEYWDYKAEGWEAFRGARPNALHHAVARLEEAGKLEGVVTQNIDGLHARAGTSRDRLVEIHGTDLLVECQSCKEMTDPEPHILSFQETLSPPICPCGGYLKQATVSFGQGLRADDLRRAGEMAAKADLVFSLGSTLGVYPAAGVPLAAAEAGAPYVIINQGETSHDDLTVVSLRLHGDVGEIFPSAVNQVLSET